MLSVSRWPVSILRGTWSCLSRVCVESVEVGTSLLLRNGRTTFEGVSTDSCELKVQIVCVSGTPARLIERGFYSGTRNTVRDTPRRRLMSRVCLYVHCPFPDTDSFDLRLPPGVNVYIIF